MSTVKLDVKDLAGFMSGVIEQVQMSTAIALTRTAKHAQGAVRDHMADVFQLRNRFTQNQVRISPATKRNPVAAVFISPQAEYLVLQETGGTKTPKGNHLAIPQDAIWPNRTRVLAKGRRPRALKEKGGKRKPFLMITESGARLIVRRKTKKRLPVEVLYSLSRTAEVDKRLQFYETVLRDVQGRFSDEFKRAFKEGLKRVDLRNTGKEWLTE
jgi:hypothetical protein